MQLKSSERLDAVSEQTGSPSNPDQWTSFKISHGAQDTAVLVLCDHATNALPPEYGLLGLPRAELDRHIGYDIGALAVAQEIGRRLKATVISTCFSRLLIDPNRGEDDPTLIMQISDGAVVPGNAALDDAERRKRISNFYAPYHAAIEAEIDAMLARGMTPIVASIHSFTDVWRGVPRKWHAAVLWDRDPRLAVPLIARLRSHTGLEIGDNEPYSGRLMNDVVYRHATMRGLPNALIEVRQDLVRNADGQEKWGTLLADSLSEILADPSLSVSLSEVVHYGSHVNATLGKSKT